MASEAVEQDKDRDKNVTSCHFFNEFVRVGFDSGQSKNISWEDFLKEFDRAFQNRRDQVEQSNELTAISRRLPTNAFIVKEDPKAETLTISMYFPEVDVDLQFKASSSEVKTYENCCLPNIIVTAKLKLNKNTNLYGLSSCLYFCTPKSLDEIDAVEPIVSVDLRNQIWSLILPNMYDNGGMCYGGNTTVSSLEIHDIRPLDWQYHLIFESPFNNDLNIRYTKDGHSCASWLSKLSRYKVFPYWLLQQAPWDTEEEFLEERSKKETGRK